ncbi:MAG: tetratricopeptide repeat protein [Kiritimatiellia bacterium]
MKKHAVISAFTRVALALVLLGLASFGRADEVTLSAEDYKKLDTLEGMLLAKADVIFAEACKDAPLKFRVAAPAYESFALQFPKSVAVPYALLRQGRSMQLDKKRFEAIKVYTQVLDYYPNVLQYAGAALCYIGDSHFDNGNVKDAMKAWAEMAKDADYRKHVLAAGAINHLADNLVAQDKWSDAVFYYEQISTDFRNSNRPAAGYAITKLRFYYVRVKPDVTKLRALYDKIAGFDDRPISPDDVDFWKNVMESVGAHGGFDDKTQKAERNSYYGYWAKSMEGKHLKWDDFQITIANYRLREEEDLKKWYDRLDKQYKDNWKMGDYDRTMKWMVLYLNHLPKLQEYYNKLAFDKMQNSQIIDLIKILYSTAGDAAAKTYPIGRGTIPRLKSGTPDSVREGLARFIWLKDGDAVEMLCKGMQDLDLAKWTLMNFYVESYKIDKALALADELVKSPGYAKKTYLVRAGIYRGKKMYNEAIGDYMMYDQPPGTFYSIAECYMEWGKPSMAITQLSEIESFFAGEAPEACLRIAYVHRATSQQKLYIAGLRSVLKKYKSSPQSSTAHQLLQQMGVDPGGGENAQ